MISSALLPYPALIIRREAELVVVAEGLGMRLRIGLKMGIM